MYSGNKWGGEPIIKMPLYVGDAGQAVLNACKMPRIEGETFELFGPDAYFLRDLYQFVMSAQHNYLPDGEHQVRQVPLQLIMAYSTLFEAFYRLASCYIIHRANFPE